MENPKGQVNKLAHTGFGVAFLIILATLGISFWGHHQTVLTFEAVIHNEEVSAELLRMFVDLKVAEDQQREFLLTEDSRYLTPYAEAVESARTRIASLEKLSLTHTRLRDFFPLVKSIIGKRMDILQEILRIRERQGAQAAVETIISGDGMQLMAQIRAYILNFQQEEVAHLTELHKDAHEMERFTISIMILGMLLTLGIALVTIRKLRKDIRDRQDLERRLFEETKVAEISRRIADIGHDIKNMLTPIQMGMTLLEDDLKDHFQKLCEADRQGANTTQELSHDVIEMTRRGGKRIQERVKEIADAVKGRSSPPQFVACEIKNIVGHVLDTLRLYAEERGVALQTQGLETLPIIRADDQRLFNAFYNLVNNAIPEVPAGGSVTIKGEISENQKEFLLSVEDTGRGMSPELQKSLFSSSTVSRKPGGTGLGTKIVKDVIDVHGGTITVESTEGKGTIFKIRLPKEGLIVSGA